MYLGKKWLQTLVVINHEQVQNPSNSQNLADSLLHVEVSKVFFKVMAFLSDLLGNQLSKHRVSWKKWLQTLIVISHEQVQNLSDNLNFADFLLHVGASKLFLMLWYSNLTFRIGWAEKNKLLSSKLIVTP